MNKLDEMNELVLSAEQILEDIKAIRDKPEEPKLYDDLTEEQWKIVIDEKLICYFWDPEECKVLSSLWEVTFDASFPFFDTMNDNWIHCKLHPLMPQFCNGTRPEGLDDDEIVLIREIDGFVTILMVVMNINWSLVKRWQRVKV